MRALLRFTRSCLLGALGMSAMMVLGPDVPTARLGLALLFASLGAMAVDVLVALLEERKSETDE